MRQISGTIRDLSTAVLQDYRLLDSQKKSFWLLFTILSLGAFFLPFWWGVGETFAAVFAIWWIIYRSGLF